MKFLNITGINCCESKKSKKVTLHNLDLKGIFEWNPQWLLSLTVFLKFPASGYSQLLPKFEQELDRI